MKKVLKWGTCALVLAGMLSGCVKLNEDVAEERIKRPQYDIDVTIDPSWDAEQDSDDLTIGK